MAGADAYVSVFDAKYAFNFWRPITAIRNGGLDGNDETVRVPHLGAAHRYTATPRVSLRALHHLGIWQRAGFPQHDKLHSASVTHNWSSIKEWADEISIARIYGGVHYRTSIVVGQATGKKIGELAVNSFVKPLR
jgi:hypothetical protein